MAAASGAAAGPGELARRRWYEDWADRLLFLFALLLGSALVVLIKLLGTGALGPIATWIAPAWAAASVAGCVLVGYAALAWLVPSLRLHPERLGDNCYYLGLLFTLVSLSLALVELGRVTPEERGALIELLLAAFGVALSSTILGIALRVWFVQMRREIDDLEQELRLELLEAASRLKGQLLEAVNELEIFRVRTTQVLDERVREAAVAVGESWQRQAALLEKNLEAIDAGLGRMRLRIEGRTEELQEAGEGAVAAARDLAGRLAAVEVPRDVLTGPVRRLGGAADRLEGLVERIRAAGERLGGQIEAIGRGTAALAERLAGLEAGVEGARAAGTSFGTLAREVDSLGERLALIGRALEGQKDSLGQVLAAAREDASQIRGLRDQIRADLAEYHRAQKELMAGLVEVASSLARRLGG